MNCTKTKFKRSTALILAMIMTATAIVSALITTVKALGTETEVFMSIFPRDGDPNYDAEWGHGDMTYMNGWTAHETDHITLRTVGSNDGDICYCIEPGVSLDVHDKLVDHDESFWDNYPSQYNKTIEPDDIKLLIGRIMQYGFTGSFSRSWDSVNEGADKLGQAMATQILIWETVVGERDADFNHVSTGGKDAVIDIISATNPIRSQIMKYYGSIVTSVQNHTKLPSFFARSTGRAETVDLEWDGSKYTASLTDTNGVLSNYTFSSDTRGVDVSVSGNKLVITSDSVPDGSVTITATKKSSQRRGIITWTDGEFKPGSSSFQDMVTYTQSASDPVVGYLKVGVSLGGAKIVKTSEDGNVSGVQFRVTGSGYDETFRTNASGVITIDSIAPGRYTVTELTENKYEPQESMTLNVVSGETATVTFSNVLKRGDLTVTKTSEDGIVDGVRFHLYGTSESGLPVDEYATTDKSGKAYFKDILIGSGYTLEEVGTPERYVVPAAQSAAVEWNTVTQKSVHNILKKWNLTVSKSDSGSGKAQGDATLAGAVYGIYKNGELVDRYSTDANGQFTTKWYVCGGDWELRELTPSEGYMIDTSTYHIGAEAGNFTVEYSPLSEAVTEDVIKGMISIIKHNDDGETKIETPEVGAEFDVYLKSEGSYENAAETERAHLVCDENGYAETPLLPYGIYTVHQTKGWDGRELMHDFDVYVSENGKVYRFLINNAVFESLVEIVKKDAETGAIIPAAGIGFKVKNADTGEFVVQHINYPTPTDIDVYYTDVTGKLMLPDTLPFGNYEVIEVQTPYGYVLDGTPVPFTVDGNETVVTVEKSNMPQKGTVTVTKSGEVFATVKEIDGIYVPVYEVRGLSGAVFEITAAEDIYTPDGTLRYAAGTVVDTITTDETGAAQSRELYLGKYEVKEITAPKGFVLNEDIRFVELSYAGQNVSVTETSTEFSNERQRVSVALEKLMEENEKFGITGSVTAVTFGLFASEEIKAADGTVIPKDGLIEILSVDENGHAECRTDLMFGEYYLRELTTDERYVLDGEKYTFTFEYAGQDKDVVHIDIGEIENELIQGNIRGEKSDCETGERVTGAVFGLFMYGETVYTEKTAVMLAVSDSDGRFGFDGIPYGKYFVVELSPADGYLPNGEKYEIVVSENEAVIELEIVNDKIPEIGTTAAADGIKSTHPTESVTVEDTVAYEHLVPGKEYMLKGVLMDKATGKPFLVDGKEITTELTFTPETADGEVTVSFTFSADGIISNTELVVFETLYLGDVELTAHADIEDEAQTVTLTPPPPETPKTGDDSSLALWLAITGISFMGALISAAAYFKAGRNGKKK